MFEFLALDIWQMLNHYTPAIYTIIDVDLPFDYSRLLMMDLQLGWLLGLNWADF